MIAGTVGPYEILDRLGEGGMGEVYRARDTRLGRSVALKLLRAHVAKDPDLRERFEREARAVSSLNHPYICTLYDVGRHADAEFLVMELVEGETLADRLQRGPLPVDGAIRVAIQVAEALDHAHRRGITHRDLKPANIMLTPSGVKLLDFGVAKLRNDSVEINRRLDSALEAAAAMSRAATAAGPRTAEGAILGTLEYMAPEQIQGGIVDERADIFSFGAVLYEAITGRRAFTATSPAAVIGAILVSTPPPVRELRDVPPLLDLVLRQCLAKEPDDRWQSARDLLVPLRWLAANELPVAAPAPSASRAAWWTGIAAVFVATAAVAYALWLGRSADSVTPALNEFDLRPPADGLFAGDIVPSIAVSRDGRQIAFRARTETGTALYVKRGAAYEPTRIPNTDGAHTPFFSPDGSRVGFLANGRIFTVPSAGGVPAPIADAPSLSPTSPGATWGEDGSIVFAAGAAGLMRVPDVGGTPQVLTVPDETRGEITHIAPHFVSGGHELLFSVRLAGGEWRVAVLTPGSGSWEYLPAIGEVVSPQFVPDHGRLVYAQAGGLFARQLDLQRRTFTGPEEQLSASVYEHGFAGTIVAQFAAADAGTVAFMAGEPPEWTLVEVTAEGDVRPVLDTPQGYRYPRVSRDRRHLAVIIEDRRSSNLHVLDLRDTRGAPPALTRTGTNTTPIWALNNLSVVFASRREGSTSYDIYSQPVTGSGDPAPLLARDGAQFPTGWVPATEDLLFDELTNRTARDILLLPSGTRDVRTLVSTPSNERAASLSIDGGWMAFVSNDSGVDEVYVRQYPSGRPEQLSVGGGTEPVWSPANPRQLFYRHGNELYEVAFRTVPSFVRERPRVLFKGDYVLGPAEGGRPNYDVMPDSRSFVMVRSLERVPTHVHVVQNAFGRR